MPDLASLLTPNPYANDDGSMPQELRKAYESSSDQRVENIVRALDRVLLPVIPHAHPGTDANGKVLEHTSQPSHPLEREEGLVTAQVHNGRSAVVVFSHAEALTNWNATARPVPVSIEATAIATLKQKTGLIVLDPGTDNETVLGRTAVITLAAGGKWLAPWADPKIRGVITKLAEEYRDHVLSIELLPDVKGTAIVDMVFSRNSATESVVAVAQAVAATLETDPYVRARLDLVEIRPRPE